MNDTLYNQLIDFCIFLCSLIFMIRPDAEPFLIRILGFVVAVYALWGMFNED